MWRARAGTPRPSRREKPPGDVAFTSDALAPPDPASASRGTELVLLLREEAEARAAPGLGAVPVLQVVKGERLRVADQVGEWYRIGDSPAGVETRIHSDLVRTGTVPAGHPVRGSVIAAMSPELDTLALRHPILEDEWTWEHVARRDGSVLSFVSSTKGNRIRDRTYIPGWCSEVHDIGKRVAPEVKIDPVFTRGGIPTWCSAEPQ